MSSRENILGRIRTETSTMAEVERPPVPEVWPRTNPSTDEMIERFISEIEAVQGEVIRCTSFEDAREKLATLLDENDWNTIGAVERPICRELLSGLPEERVAWERENPDPKQMAQLPVGLVTAGKLLADTGSCLVSCDTPEQRLMCYLPSNCIVAAWVEQLVEHLPAAWDEVRASAAEPGRRGEFVIITGPSRTADIEKILILGVHGPKRLIVLLID